MSNIYKPLMNILLESQDVCKLCYAEFNYMQDLIIYTCDIFFKLVYGDFLYEFSY